MINCGTLPKVKIKILNAEELCNGMQLILFDAPEPSSSSEPYDVDPVSVGDDEGYVVADDGQFRGRPFGVVAPGSSGSASALTATGSGPGGNQGAAEPRKRRNRKIRSRGE